MTSTLALLGFLALTFLLVSRALSAFRQQDGRTQERQQRQTEPREPQDRLIAG